MATTSGQTGAAARPGLSPMSTRDVLRTEQLPSGTLGPGSSPGETKSDLRRTSRTRGRGCGTQPPGNEQPSLRPVRRAARLCLKAGGPSEGRDPSAWRRVRGGTLGGLWNSRLRVPGHCARSLTPESEGLASSLAQAPACSPRGQVGLPRPLNLPLPASCQGPFEYVQHHPRAVHKELSLRCLVKPLTNSPLLPRQGQTRRFCGVLGPAGRHSPPRVYKLGM